MTLEVLIARYGLIALFFGAGIEGEATVLAGGTLAHRGLIALPGAITATGLGSFAADQILFLIGRRYRNVSWVKRLHRKPAFDRAIALIERHPSGFIFAFRFLYGVRMISPVAIGTTKVPAHRFVLVNAAAALVWSVGFSMAGFLFGPTIAALIDRVATPAHILGIACVVIAVAFAIRLVRRAVGWKRPPSQA